MDDHNALDSEEVLGDRDRAKGVAARPPPTIKANTVAVEPIFLPVSLRRSSPG
ncbi:hypothetical protein OIE50_51250 [Streptomyces canus]|uniref:hypothetical protein n=1 Tax=Streptomyces canus TaxID=58343 RepID=UPI003243F7E5